MPTAPSEAAKPLSFSLQLPYLIYRVAARLERKASRLLAELQINVADARILSILLELDHIRISDLGNYLELPQPTISHQVAKMVRRRLLSKRRMDDDARSVAISLTKKGRATAERCKPMCAVIVRAATSAIDHSTESSIRWYLRELHAQLGS